MMYGGMLVWPGFMAAEVARAYRDFIAEAPDEIGGAVAFITAPPEPFVPEEARGKPAVGLILTYTGSAEDGERVLAPLRDLGPAVDLVGPIPYLGAQRLIEPGNQPGHRHYWKADLLDELTDDAIDTIAAIGMRMASPLTVMLFQPLGGAVARVPASATALGRRDAAWAYHALSQWEQPEDDETNIAWTRELADAMKPYSSGGVYITYTSDDGDDRVRDAYRDHYDRLVAIKDRYDPGNLFHLGQNIRPSVEAAARADRP
jgi:FAD/FMN-containing dehydrogenase